jgi:O-methyltransferase
VGVHAAGARLWWRWLCLNWHWLVRFGWFDTFKGLPPPTAEDPDFEIADLFTGDCVGTVDEVPCLFERLQVSTGVQLVEGLFQDTLPVAPIQHIAILHIDGDWYESVKACLENLYDKVTPGGVVQLDDYGYWKGARKAVDEFLYKRGIREPLRTLDYSGRLLLKPQ